MAAVQNFRGNCASSTVVKVGFNDFRLKPVEKPEFVSEQEMMWAYEHIVRLGMGLKKLMFL